MTETRNFPPGPFVVIPQSCVRSRTFARFSSRWPCGGSRLCRARGAAYLRHPLGLHGADVEPGDQIVVTPYFRGMPERGTWSCSSRLGTAAVDRLERVIGTPGRSGRQPARLLVIGGQTLAEPYVLRPASAGAIGAIVPADCTCPRRQPRRLARQPELVVVPREPDRRTRAPRARRSGAGPSATLRARSGAARIRPAFSGLLRCAVSSNGIAVNYYSHARSEGNHAAPS